MQYIPLSLIKSGTKAVIKLLLPNTKLKRKLLYIGITPELEVLIIFQHPKKGVVLELGNFRVALNRYTSEHVLAVPA